MTSQRTRRLKRVVEHGQEKVAFELRLHGPRWLWWSAAAAVASALFSYLLLDWPLAQWAHTLGAPAEAAAGALTRLGKSGQWLLAGGLATAVLIVLRRRWWAQRTGLLVAAVAVSGLIVNVLKVLFGRARPEAWWNHQIWGFDPLTLGRPMDSFPSGHATTLGAIAMAMILTWPRAWWAIAPAVATVAFSRVMIEAHYLSDVIVGLYLGALTTLALRDSLFKPLGWWNGPVVEPAKFIIPANSGHPRPSPPSHDAPGE